MIRRRSTHRHSFHSRFTPCHSTILFRVHAGNAANSFLSRGYFITRVHPRVGAPVARASACAPSWLRPRSTRASAPLNPPSTRHRPIAAIPLCPFVMILDAASSISPVFATLKKTPGVGYPLFRRESSPPFRYILSPCLNSTAARISTRPATKIFSPPCRPNPPSA